MADMFYTDTITVWNVSHNGLWQTETWVPTVIEDVRVIQTHGTKLSDDRIVSTNGIKVHIHDTKSRSEKEYIATDKYSDCDKDQYYTLQINECTFITSGDTSDEVPTQSGFFSYMKSKYPDTYYVRTVKHLSIIPHFEIWGY